MADLIERASVRAGEISTGTTSVARDNQGIDLELLIEILLELRKLNARETSLKLRPIFKPRPEPESKPEPKSTIEPELPSRWRRMRRWLGED